MRLCSGCGQDVTGLQRTKCNRCTVRDWRAANPERSRQVGYAYQRDRLKQDKAFRAAHMVRLRVNKFLKGKSNYQSSLGCSLAEFKAYVELQFKPGMTWDNYGEWQIDHKYPLIVAYREGQEKFAKACHYTNIQPLWRYDNQSKGARIV